LVGGTLGSVRGSDFDVFGTGKIDPSVQSKSFAVGDRRSADAAANRIKPGFAFGVIN